MKNCLLLVAASLLASCLDAAPCRFHVLWRGGRPHGEVRVTDGKLVGPATFSATRSGPFRLDLAMDAIGNRYGAGATIVSIAAPGSSFSFFLRDVRRDHPILLPAYGVAVSTGDDPRSYSEIEDAVRARGLRTKLQEIEAEPEETFENAALSTRAVTNQTWLGLARDIRIFAVGERLDWIQPRLHGREIALPETDNKVCKYQFIMGRGWGPLDQISRRLEDGVLPILRGSLTDDEVVYDFTAFVALESSPLTASTVHGTHFLVADGYGGGHMFTPEQQARFDALRGPELQRAEETVLYLRVVAANTARVPRYAFFKNPWPSPAGKRWQFDGARGFGLFDTGRVAVVSSLDGRPLAAQELALQLAPGEAATFDVRLPNQPISVERAAKLSTVDLSQRLAECRAYWRAKLAAASRIHVPEPRIDQMIRAGLLHLDLITYGHEPAGTLAPTIGVYSPIGSESSPIIQFMDSMAWHDVARRSLDYFLEKQHPDGFIQNFGGYMLETGAALWSMGEHYRYTREDAWVRAIAPKLIKSCEFLSRWRARNLRQDLRGKGYGMLEGKTADPEDPFRSFMLNGYAYLGLARVAEMLRQVDPAASAKWDREAQALRRDIRTAFFESMERSPVIPLADGTWCPTAPPWVEYRGPLSLYADGGLWFTHGAMVSRDSLLGPLYLVFQEVLDPTEPAAGFLLDFHNDLMTTRNAAFSQPYYSRHPIVHLRRGEVKPFLKAYYNTVAALADRETYSFREHYFGASPHKTHEEAWFLMDTRWMLYMERGRTLDLLSGIPRAWLEDGKRIELRDVATYFGPVSLRVESRLEEGVVKAVVECRGPRRPEAVELRLPHPLGRRAASVSGGVYDAARERVRIAPFAGKAEIEIRF